jgi:hypothetical protein
VRISSLVNDLTEAERMGDSDLPRRSFLNGHVLWFWTLLPAEKSDAGGESSPPEGAECQELW